MNKNLKTQYYQGDVALTAVDSVPKNAKKMSSPGQPVIVARGEATGHHHSFAPNSGVELFQDTDRNVMVMTVPKGGADLVHQEHDTIKVDEGTYEYTPQMEYDHQVARQVRD